MGYKSALRVISRLKTRWTLNILNDNSNIRTLKRGFDRAIIYEYENGILFGTTKVALPFRLKMYAWKLRFTQQRACNLFTMNILLIYFCVLNINLFSERQYLISKFESIFVSFKIIICCKESYLMQVYRKTEANEIWQVRICCKI